MKIKQDTIQSQLNCSLYNCSDNLRI